jgi:hypothetical protein
MSRILIIVCAARTGSQLVFRSGAYGECVADRGQRGGNNFVRIHKSLRCTPAMAAGVTNRLWEIEDIVALLPESEAKPRGPYKKGQAASYRFFKSRVFA